MWIGSVERGEGENVQSDGEAVDNVERERSDRVSVCRIPEVITECHTLITPVYSTCIHRIVFHQFSRNSIK